MDFVDIPDRLPRARPGPAGRARRSRSSAPPLARVARCAARLGVAFALCALGGGWAVAQDDAAADWHMLPGYSGGAAQLWALQTGAVAALPSAATPSATGWRG
jgi:hypothetical protein